MNTPRVGLADAIEALREELIEAVTRGENQVLQFGLEPVELTIQVAVTKNAGGKVGWMVLEADATYEKVATQTLTLKLAPLWEREDGTRTRDFAIASNTVKGDVTSRRQRPTDGH